MNELLVSIIVPVYNTADYLPCCLESLVNQTYSHLEIICVDDGSTDDSWKVLQEYAAKDARVKIFHQENAGVSAARNKALAHAGGELLAFVDSDDWLERNALQCCVDCFCESEVELVCFQTLSEFSGVQRVAINNSGRKKKGLIDSLFILKNQLDPKNKIIRRVLLEKTQIRFPEDLSYAEDCVVGLCAYAGMTGENYGYVLNERLYHYRQREDSAMGQARKKNRRGIQQLYAMKNVYDFMQTHGASPAFHKAYPVIFWYFVNMALDTTPSEMHAVVRTEALRMAKEQGISPVGYMERRLRPLSRVEKLFHWFRGSNECFGLLGKSIWTITCQPTEKQYRFMGRLVYQCPYAVLR